MLYTNHNDIDNANANADADADSCTLDVHEKYVVKKCDMFSFVKMCDQLMSQDDNQNSSLSWLPATWFGVDVNMLKWDVLTIHSTGLSPTKHNVLEGIRNSIALYGYNTHDSAHDGAKHKHATLQHTMQRAFHTSFRLLYFVSMIVHR
jgi:hypothetical protein